MPCHVACPKIEYEKKSPKKHCFAMVLYVKNMVLLSKMPKMWYLPLKYYL